MICYYDGTLILHFVIFIPLCIVPTPGAVNVTAPNTQIVGQSLTLECSVTTVRGITSRVDVVWSIRNGSNVVVTENVNATSETDDSLLFESSYIVPLLSTDDDGSMHECEIVINTDTLVVARSGVVLDVTG